MSDIINDNGVVGFSRVLTIDGTSYVADDFKFDEPEGVSFTRTNEKSVPTGQVSVRGVTTGSATLQLETSSTDLPEFGAQFTEDEGTFFITSVGRSETKDGETKVPITFKKAIGSVTTE